MSRFRTIELSDPAHESPGLRRLTVKSPNLLGRGDITAFVPRGVTSPAELPVVILLHGVYGSHWAWSEKAGAHTTTQRLIDAGRLPPVLLAMPSDGLMFDGSAYLPHNERRFDRWITDDVVAAMVQAGLPTSESAPRCLAGLSMGGYGALRLGASTPDRFAAFAAHSAITDTPQLGLFVEEDLNVYGDPSVDRSVLSAITANRDRLPPFRFDCGVDDLLIEPNRQLHAQLEEAGIEHGYQENDGGHEWPYWTRHLEDTLDFFAQHLGGAGSSV